MLQWFQVNYWHQDTCLGLREKKIILSYFRWVSDPLSKSHLDNQLPGPWPNAFCLAPLQPDSNFLLHSVDAAFANTSHRWLIILASWHLTLLQAPLTELKIPLAELILACSNLKSLALLCMEAAEICAHKGRESKFFWGKPIFNKSWT